MSMDATELLVGSRRTPQGVRGLKFPDHGLAVLRALVAPRKGCVD